MGNELTLSVNSFYWSFVVTGLLWLLCWYISLKAKEEGTWKYAVMALWNWLISYGKELLGDSADEVAFSSHIFCLHSNGELVGAPTWICGSHS